MKKNNRFPKLSSSAGETILEVLVTILIVTLTVTGLVGTINAAAKMNRQSSDYNTTTRTQQQTAETFLSGVGDSKKTGTLELKCSGVEDTTIALEVSSDDTGELAAFRIAAAGEETP